MKGFQWVTVDRLALDSATIESPLVVVQIWDFCHHMIITFSGRQERKKNLKVQGAGMSFPKAEKQVKLQSGAFTPVPEAQPALETSSFTGFPN